MRDIGLYQHSRAFSGTLVAMYIYEQMAVRSQFDCVKGIDLAGNTCETS